MTLNITIEDLRTVLSAEGQDQRKAVGEFHSKAVRTYKSGMAAADKAIGKGTLAAALDTHLAERTGDLVARGTRLAKGATGHSGQSWADEYGVGGSAVTAWRALGHAVVVSGVDPEAEDTSDNMSTWRLLAFKGAATNKVVGEAIYADGSTEESIRAAVLTVREPNGAVRRDNDGTGTSRAGGAQEEAGLSLAEQITTDPVAAALAALKIAADAVKAIALDNSDGYAEVEAAWNRIATTRVRAVTTYRAEQNSNRSGRTGAKKAAAKKSAAIPA